MLGDLTRRAKRERRKRAAALAESERLKKWDRANGGKFFILDDDDEDEDEDGDDGEDIPATLDGQQRDFFE